MRKGEEAGLRHCVEFVTTLDKCFAPTTTHTFEHDNFPTCHTQHTRTHNNEKFLTYNTPFQKIYNVYEVSYAVIRYEEEIKVRVLILVFLKLKH